MHSAGQQQQHATLGELYGTAAGTHTCQLFSHTLCCSVSATRGLWYQLLGGVCACIMTALSTSMHSMTAREESIPQLAGS